MLRSRVRWKLVAVGVGLIVIGMGTMAWPWVTQPAFRQSLPAWMQVALWRVAGTRPVLNAWNAAYMSKLSTKDRELYSQIAVDIIREDKFALATVDRYSQFLISAQNGQDEWFPAWRQLFAEAPPAVLESIFSQSQMFRTVFPPLPPDLEPLVPLTVIGARGRSTFLRKAAPLDERIKAAFDENGSIDIPLAMELLRDGPDAGAGLTRALVERGTFLTSFQSLLAAAERSGSAEPFTGLAPMLPTAHQHIERARDTYLLDSAGEVVESLIELRLLDGLPEALTRMARTVPCDRLDDLTRAIAPDAIRKYIDRQRFLPVVRALCERMDDPRCARGAYRVLVELVNKWGDAINIVIEYADAPSDAQRYYACATLIRSSLPDRVRPVLQKLAADDPNPMIRRICCEALQRWDNPRAHPWDLTPCP